MEVEPYTRYTLYYLLEVMILAGMIGLVATRDGGFLFIILGGMVCVWLLFINVSLMIDAKWKLRSDEASDSRPEEDGEDSQEEPAVVEEDSSETTEESETQL